MDTSLFCASLPVQKAWDNTSMAALKKCARYYEYKIVKGLQPKGLPRPPLLFGSEFHAALERFDAKVALGMGWDEALVKTLQETALRVALYTRKEDERDGNGAPMKVDVACEADDPEGTFQGWILDQLDDPVRTTHTLLRSIVWYTEHYRLDYIKTHMLPNGKPAVELSFRLELPLTNPDGEAYLYCGHLDKVGEKGEILVTQERKHSKQALSGWYFDKYSPNAQVSGYLFGGQAILSQMSGEPRPITELIVDATQVGATFNRFQRGFVTRTKSQLDEWLNNTLHWITQAETYTRENFWPMNEEACHGRFGKCEFADVCGRAPEVRPMLLKSGFVHRPWNPLENRGDD